MKKIKVSAPSIRIFLFHFIMFTFLFENLSASSESIVFSGMVKASQGYSHVFADHFIFKLTPTKEGWEIQVFDKNRPKENLARFGSDDRFINEKSMRSNDGDKTREFIFSPKVGQTIQNYRSSDPVTDAEVEEIRHDGHGLVEITYLKNEMDFQVTIDTFPHS